MVSRKSAILYNCSTFFRREAERIIDGTTIQSVTAGNQTYNQNNGGGVVFGPESSSPFGLHHSLCLFPTSIRRVMKKGHILIDGTHPGAGHIHLIVPLLLMLQVQLLYNKLILTSSLILRSSVVSPLCGVSVCLPYKCWG